MKQVDRIIRGAAASITLVACLQMTANSGGALNPALGIAQSIYMIGVENQNGSGLGSTDAKYIWVYVAGPLIGALFAAAFFRLHDYIEKSGYQQNQPMQFVGLLKSGTDAGNIVDRNSVGGGLVQNEQRSQIWSQLHNNLLDSRSTSVVENQ